MKRIAYWYKKWNQELESKFLASLIKINFMTNFLIFISLSVFLIIRSLPGNIQSLGFWNAIFGVAIYSVTILVHALGISYFVPNYLCDSVCYFSLVYDSGTNFGKGTGRCL